MANVRQQQKKKAARKARNRWNKAQGITTGGFDEVILLHLPERPQYAAGSVNQPLIMRNIPGVLRMSEVIAHLAEPVFDLYPDDAIPEESIIRATIAAWNFTLHGNRLPFLSRLEQVILILIHGRARFAQIRELVEEGKCRFYPNVDRYILGVNFSTLPDGDGWFEVMHAQFSDRYPNSKRS